MANIGDIAKGLKLFIRGLDFQLTGTAGPTEIKTRLAKYELHHLEGTACPNCKEVGTLVRIIPDQKDDVAMHALPSHLGDDRDEINADTFDLVSRLHFDTPTGLNIPDNPSVEDIVRAQIGRETQVESQSPGWICFECEKSAATVEFIGQLTKG